jgi:hypothetical protein
MASAASAEQLNVFFSKEVTADRARSEPRDEKKLQDS